MKKENLNDHPFKPFIPEGAKKLLIGTIPPQRFCKSPPELSSDDVNFYYGSKDNEFWPIIQEIFNETLNYENNISSIDQRKELLTKQNIGITDIVDQCTRVDNK